MCYLDVSVLPLPNINLSLFQVTCSNSSKKPPIYLNIHTKVTNTFTTCSSTKVIYCDELNFPTPVLKTL